MIRFKMLPEWKEAEPWLKQGHDQAMQSVGTS